MASPVRVLALYGAAPGRHARRIGTDPCRGNSPGHPARRGILTKPAGFLSGRRPIELTAPARPREVASAFRSPWAESKVAMPRRSRDESGETPHNRLALQERVREMLVLERLCSRFPLVAEQLQSRHADRSTIHVQDEYDVEDLLRALLTLEHDDIRPETSAPGYAGGRPRTAFLLKLERIVIEVKVAGGGFGVDELERQVSVDIQAHQQHPDCRTLVCFVYDPERRLAKPHEIEDALSGERDGLRVRVLIAPKGQ